MYEFTLPDTVILVIFLAIIVIMFMAWPRRGESINIREQHFIIGVNAIRVGWNSTTDKHTVLVMLGRESDIPPSIGGIIHFIEKGGDAGRYKVVEPPVILRGSQQGHIKLVTIPVK